MQKQNCKNMKTDIQFYATINLNRWIIIIIIITTKLLYYKVIIIKLLD